MIKDRAERREARRRRIADKAERRDAKRRKLAGRAANSLRETSKATRETQAWTMTTWARPAKARDPAAAGEAAIAKAAAAANRTPVSKAQVKQADGRTSMSGLFHFGVYPTTTRGAGMVTDRGQHRANE